MINEKSQYLQKNRKKMKIRINTMSHFTDAGQKTKLESYATKEGPSMILRLFMIILCRVLNKNSKVASPFLWY